MVVSLLEMVAETETIEVAQGLTLRCLQAMNAFQLRIMERKPDPTVEYTGEAQVQIGELEMIIPLKAKTLRNLRCRGEFVEGKHYSKPRGRVLWFVKAMKEWYDNPSKGTSIDIPLVRSLRYGR